MYTAVGVTVCPSLMKLLEIAGKLPVTVSCRYMLFEAGDFASALFDDLFVKVHIDGFLKCARDDSRLDAQRIHQHIVLCHLSKHCAECKWRLAYYNGLLQSADTPFAVTGSLVLQRTLDRTLDRLGMSGDPFAARLSLAPYRDGVICAAQIGVGSVRD